MVQNVGSSEEDIQCLCVICVDVWCRMLDPSEEDIQCLCVICVDVWCRMLDPLKRIYSACVLSVLMYGAECWIL